MMYKIVLFILAFTCSIDGYSQSDTISSDNQGTFYDPSSKDKVSLGIITGWNQFKYGTMEAGIGFAYSDYGRHGILFSAVSISTELDPWREIYGLKVSAWKTIAMVPFTIFSFGLNGAYFEQHGIGDWTFRPMLGVGIINFQLVYAYDITLGKRNITERNSHMISLRFYIPLIKLNK